MQESANKAGLAAQALHISKKDLSLGLSFAWLQGDELWALRIFYLTRTFLHAEAMGHMVPVSSDSVCDSLRMSVFCFWGAGVWIAEAGHPDTVWLCFWPAEKLLNTTAQVSFPWLATLHWENEVHLCFSTGRSYMKAHTWISWTSSHVLFPSSGFNLYLFFQ